MTSGRTAIILDFDRTLFDADAYKLGLRDAVKGFGVTKAIWDEAYEEANGAVRFKPFVELMAKRTGRSVEQLLRAIEKETAEAIWYLYADSREFLEEFAPVSRMFLLTYSDPYIQRQKIAAVGLSQYFQEVTVVDEPKAESGKLPISAVDQAIFINDNVDEMLELARVYRWAHHLHINRAGKPLPPRFAFPSFRDLRSAALRVRDIITAERPTDKTLS